MTNSVYKPDFPIAEARRCLITLSGADAASFLQATITADIAAAAEAELRPAALLSPQGKILFDFLIGRLPAEKGAESFQIDIAASLAEDFRRRLSLYILRRAVEISPPKACAALLAAKAAPHSWRDCRFSELMPVWRSYSAADSAEAQRAAENAPAWDRLRIEAGIPESGRDFAVNDIFPHDVNYDAFGAVALNKGCYIGQEVVSRMQHKALIRKRLMRAQAEQNLPQEGTEITCGGKAIGRLGTVCGRQGLAVIRIDRLSEAQTGEQAQAASRPLHFSPPPYLSRRR